ncbi:MAG: UPF0280 family protein [Candidatus Delongbacteria bacterium]|nr:UPF0280 family protein [Candidatus Delongbacteria bacterium]
MIVRERYRQGETIANLMAEPDTIPIIKHEMGCRRRQIQDYIRRDPEFLSSLEPRPVADDAPWIVKRMARAAQIAGVGPMAAVAGAIAAAGVESALSNGADHVIIDNGGDIALATTQPITIGLYTYNSPFRDLAVIIPPTPRILGICTSSGVIGHSLSFGNAQAATVFSHDPCLADAMATALGNRITSPDPAAIQTALEHCMHQEILGCIVIIDDYIGLIGEIPKLCRSTIDYESIAK